MEYISTRNTQKIFSFKDVFLKGLAPDGGLFVPKIIPSYTFQELEKLKDLSYQELAAKIIFKFSSNEFNEQEIKNLVNEANSAWLALGNKNLKPTLNEKKMLKLKRSIFVTMDLQKGSVLNKKKY